MNAPLGLPPDAAAHPAVPSCVSRSEERKLLLWMALFAVLYLIFYPRLYTSIDEASTFRMAYLLRHGSIFTHDNGFFPSISPPGPHGRMYRFPIGFPALLTPLTLLGWHALFLLNPLLHLVATWFFAHLMKACRIPPGWAVLYLLYPVFVLFDRTLFSDAFAASLTTIALSLLMRRRTALAAGLCLGVALTARAASLPVAALILLALLVTDLRTDGRPFHLGRALPFGLGLLPFCLINGLYNWATMGSVFRSAYSASQLSLHGVLAIGPHYVIALMLLFPGMLLAPFFYRGPYWKVGLAATTIVLLLAVSYNESTFGNNSLQTLLTTPRQILPVMPFYLLAYCGVLTRLLSHARLRRFPAPELAGGLLFVLAIGVSAMHQKYLQSLVTIQSQIAGALPARSTVYANKDAFKLHQPIWDGRTYRELPFVSDAQIADDLHAGPVFIVLDVRSRGFSEEDADNVQIQQDLAARFRLAPGPALGSPQLECDRVLGVRSLGGAS
jgi:hypothetical protein